MIQRHIQKITAFFLNEDLIIGFFYLWRKIKFKQSRAMHTRCCSRPCHARPQTGISQCPVVLKRIFSQFTVICQFYVLKTKNFTFYISLYNFLPITLWGATNFEDVTFQHILKGTVPWGFLVSVFFMNQHLINPWWSVRNSYIFFSEFAEIFVHEVWLSTYYLRNVNYCSELHHVFLIYILNLG